MMNLLGTGCKAGFKGGRPRIFAFYVVKDIELNLSTLELITFVSI